MLTVRGCEVEKRTETGECTVIVTVYQCEGRGAHNETETGQMERKGDKGEMGIGHFPDSNLFYSN